MLEDEIITIELQEIFTQPFGQLTDEQIEKMLNAHYNGSIDIADYWHVGDTRVVQLTNLGNSGYRIHVDQKMTMVIIGIEHDDLKEQIGERTKAAITVQCREVLGNNGNEEYTYVWGKKDVYINDTDNWLNNPMRTWYNQNFVNAMSETFNKLIKTVQKKNLKYHTKVDEAPIISEDKAFLLSVPEVFGTKSTSGYIGNQKLEGTRYEYYKTSSNIQKYANNDGTNSTSPGQWWLRSPSSASISTQGYEIFCVNTNYAAIESTHQLMGTAPAFCL